MTNDGRRVMMHDGSPWALARVVAQWLCQGLHARAEIYFFVANDELQAAARG
jgi:hypothetical protein